MYSAIYDDMSVRGWRTKKARVSKEPWSFIIETPENEAVNHIAPPISLRCSICFCSRRKPVNGCFLLAHYTDIAV